MANAKPKADQDLLASQLDALMAQLESNTAAPTATTTRADTAATPSSDDAVEAALWAPPRPAKPATPPPAPTPPQATTADHAPAIAAVEEADDLARQLERLLAAPLETEPAPAAPAPLNPAASRFTSELDALLSAPTPSPTPTPSDEDALDQGTYATLQQLGVEEPANSGPAPQAAARVVAALEPVSEDQLLSQLDSLLAGEAAQELNGEPGDYASMDDLASMLGVSHDELDAIPPAPAQPEPAPAANATPGKPPATAPAAAVPGDETTEDFDRLGLFLSPQEVVEFDANPRTFFPVEDAAATAASPEDDSWFEPPVKVRPVKAVASTLKPDADAQARQDAQDAAAAVAAAAQTAERTRRTFLAKLKLAWAILIALKPYALIALGILIMLAKAVCFVLSKPIDLVLAKLTKPDQPTPPVKVYVGYAALPLLAGGVLLMITALIG